MDMDENRIFESIKNEDVYYMTLKMTQDKVERVSEGKYAKKSWETVDTYTRGVFMGKWRRLCHVQSKLVETALDDDDDDDDE
jgi:hypothetical protein